VNHMGPSKAISLTTLNRKGAGRANGPTGPIQFTVWHIGVCEEFELGRRASPFKLIVVSLS